MSGIKNLDENKKSVTIYTQEVNTMNPVTGEVVPQKDVRIVKEQGKNNFIQLYIDNIQFLCGKELTNLERQCLLASFVELNYLNIVRIDNGFRETVRIRTGLSQGSVSKGLNGLIKKGIFLKVNEENKEIFNVDIYTGKEYLVNPQLVGKGSFKDMRQLRQTVVTDFDFETLEMKQETTIETKYEGFNDVISNLDKHELKEIKQFNNDNGKNNMEIIVKEKDEYVPARATPQEEKSVIVYPQSTSIKTYDNKEIELKIKKEENEQKRLDIEALKLKIELAKIEKSN